MKKIVIIIILTALSFVGYGQINGGVKLNNANFYGGIWVRDSIFSKLKINTDSSYYIKNNRILHYNSTFGAFGVGYYVLNYNTGSNIVASGSDVLNNNIGNYIGASGFSVLNYNTGGNIGASGSDVLNYNTGSKIGASGRYVLNYNTGSNIGASGSDVLNGNTGNYVVANGINLGANNSLSNWYFYGTGKDSTDVPINGYMGSGGYRNHLIGRTMINNSYWLPLTTGTTGQILTVSSDTTETEWTTPNYLTLSDTSIIETKSYADKTYTKKSDRYYETFIQATSTNLSNTTLYFGNLPTSMTTSATTRKITVRNACTIIAAEILFQATSTAGTNENISVYIRVNNTTDYLIQTVGVASTERNFTNSSLNIPLVSGDYYMIKIVIPAMSTYPAGVVVGGNIKIKY